MEEPGRLQSMGSQRVGHDSATPLVLVRGNVVHFYVSLQNRIADGKRDLNASRSPCCQETTASRVVCYRVQRDHVVSLFKTHNTAPTFRINT